MAEPQQAGLPDGWSVVEPSAPKAGGYWEDRGIGGQVWHPPGGASERKREDNSIAGLPPELAVTSGLGVARAVAGAGSGLAGRVVAGGKALAEQVTPQLKYEITKTSLRAMGVPEPLAIGAALAVSGFKRGAKGAAAEAEAAAGPHLDTSVPARPSELTAPELAARVKSGTGAPAAVETPLELTRRLKAENAARVSAAGAPAAPPESVSGGTPPPAGPPPESVPAVSQSGPAKSPQQLLNEEGLARRRAEYQARLAATPQAQAPAPAAPPRVKVPASQMKEYIALRQQGKTHQEAVDAIEAGRAFQERFGTPSPTAAETRFPKGMRGRTAPKDE